MKTQRETQMNTATERRDFSKSLHQKKLIWYSPCDSQHTILALEGVLRIFKDLFYILWKIVFFLQIPFLDSENKLILFHLKLSLLPNSQLPLFSNNINWFINGNK